MPLPGLAQNLGEQPTNHNEQHDVPKRVEIKGTEKYRSDQTAIPYRGSVDHGGGKIADPKSFNSDLDDDLWKDDPVKPDQEIDPPTPVPVYIVADEIKGYRLPSFRVQVVYAKSAASRIVGRHDARRRTLIKSLATDQTVVVIGHSEQSAQLGFGYPLAPNEVLELTSTTQDIWASCNGSDPVQLSVLVEYDVIVP